jgi:hypothetical protein
LWFNKNSLQTLFKENDLKAKISFIPRKIEDYAAFLESMLLGSFSKNLKLFLKKSCAR